MKQTFSIPLNAKSVTVETLDPVFDVVTPPPVNHAPVANAGQDQVITLPNNSVQLTGAATDPDTDGTVVAYMWERISGSGTISSPNSKNTTITSLAAGSSIFRLTATDNLGATGTDDVIITVNNATPPPPPPPAGYVETYRNGFDKMTDLTDNNGQYGNGSVVTNVFKTGPGSFYSVPANVSSGIRSEWQSGTAAQNPEEGAIEYDAMYIVAPKDNCHSCQWHPSTGGGSASPGLWHINGKFNVVNWKGGGNTEHDTGVVIPLNRWLHMRMEYKFGTAGYFNLYIDGVKINGGSWVGQVGDNSGHYLKLGFNGWGSDAASSRIYFDNLVIYKKQ